MKIKYKYILFDLDGTIIESANGVRTSLEHAITSLGKPVPDLDDYTRYIGPPLIDTFRNICGFNEEDCQRGTELYRSYYNEKGKYMNRLYSGIEELLLQLKNTGVRIAVCSSKYEKFAREIIEILGVQTCFDAICGSNFDGSRKDKKDLIPYAVSSLGGNLEKDKQSVVILGDTYFDARGARLCGVDFIGVKYGYGAPELMKKEGARVFAETPGDVLPLLRADI